MLANALSRFSNTLTYDGVHCKPAQYHLFGISVSILCLRGCAKIIHLLIQRIARYARELLGSLNEQIGLSSGRPVCQRNKKEILPASQHSKLLIFNILTNECKCGRPHKQQKRSILLRERLSRRYLTFHFLETETICVSFTLHVFFHVYCHLQLRVQNVLCTSLNIFSMLHFGCWVIICIFFTPLSSSA